MKRLTTLALACATTLFAAGCSASEVNRSASEAAAKSESPKEDELAAFKAAIRAKYDLKEKAFLEHDAEAIVTKFYSPDARSVSASDAHSYAGVDEFRKVYNEVVPITASVKIESIDTYVNGDAGWDWANFYVTPEDATQKPFSFMILFLWSRENGEWVSKGDYYTIGEFRAHASED